MFGAAWPGIAEMPDHLPPEYLDLRDAEQESCVMLAGQVAGYAVISVIGSSRTIASIFP